MNRTVANPKQDTAANYQQRYYLHALLRALAREKLAQDFAEMKNDVLFLIADYFTELCVRNSRNYFDEFDELDREWSNIQATMQWTLQQRLWLYFIRGLDGLSTPHLGTLGYLDVRGSDDNSFKDPSNKKLPGTSTNLDVSGRWSQAKEWIDMALHWLASMVPPDLTMLPELWFKRGVFALRLGDLDTARQDLVQAEDAFSGATANPEDVRLRQAQVCHFLSQLEVSMRNAEAALDWLNKAARLLNELPGKDVRLEVGYTYIRKGSALGSFGRVEEVQPALEAGLALLPDMPTTARLSGLISLGTLNAILGNPQQAIAAWDNALLDARSLGDKRRQLDLLRNRANLQAEYGGFALTIKAYLQAL